MRNYRTTTTLPIPWCWPARIGWIALAAACVVVFVLSSIETLRAPLPSCAPPAACPTSIPFSLEDARMTVEMGLPFFLPVYLSFSMLARLLLAAVGLVIFWRRSDDWMALMLSAALMTVLLEGTQGYLPQFDGLVNLLFAIGTALFIPLPFVFPNGRVEPGWARWPMLAVTVVYASVIPLTVHTTFFATASGVMALIWILLALYAMPYRYFRVATPTERQQIKWVLVGMSATFITASIYSSIGVFLPISQPSPARIAALLLNMLLYPALYGFFAFSILVAMLRHRLWDVDVLIRRTLQYTLLTALLALVYFGSIVLLQTLFGSMTGTQSPAVIVISTLLIATLFTPLRRRVQQLIDRRFFRKKYDAQQVLAQFALTARDETDLDALTGELQRVVQETLQPEGVSIWLRK